jgi:hypothetical protein
MLLLSNCAKMLDQAWNKNQSDFGIRAIGETVGYIRIRIDRNEHLDVKNANVSGEYFRGYYIYRNTESPYEDFTLIGIDAYSKLTAQNHSAYEEVHGSAANIADNLISDPGKGPGIFIDACVPNKIFYYRVVSVYRKWNGSSWASDLIERYSSSWTAGYCPNEMLYPF